MRSTTFWSVIVAWGQQPQAPDLDFPLAEPGRYLVRCGVHPWMYAWVVIPDHPYFGVTGPAGEVIMPSVPEGVSTLRVWHETLGEAQRRITVEQDPTAVTIQMAPQTNSGRST